MREIKRSLSRSFTVFLVAVLLAMLAVVWGSADVVHGATLTVDSTRDTIDVNPGDGLCEDGRGRCTLRAAIMETNALVGADIIELPANTYIITIAGNAEDAGETGDLDIDDDLTIVGAGADVTIIDGGALDRVVHIISGVVDISGVTIQNGRATDRAGGGFRVVTTLTLTLTDSTITGNTSASFLGGGAAYIDNPSTMTITNSIISDNTTTAGWGGGFHNHGLLIINSSTLSGNTAGNGGGSYSGEGISILTGVTIINNWAGNFGGGIGNSGPMTLINSTVSNNTAASTRGGGIQNTARLTVINSTITDNDAALGGGGIYRASGTVLLLNSIIAGNTGPEGPDCGGSPTSLGHNLIGDATDCGYVATIGDQVGTADNPVDPLLGPLQNNGGETETYALLFGSSAIDAIPVDACNDELGNPVTEDQRGVARPQGAECDIGSYEAESAAFPNTFMSPMTGAEEVPPVRTRAKGLARFKLDDTETQLQFGVLVGSIEGVTAAHIHCAPLGETGAVGVTLYEGGPVDIERGILAAGSITTPDVDNGCGWTDLDDIFAGLQSGDTYVNVHTEAWPGGEIRGQVEGIES